MVYRDERFAMKLGPRKFTGAIAGALVIASVVLPATTSGAAASSRNVALTGCAGGVSIPGTVITSTSRGITTTRTTYSGEITTTRIVPVGTAPSRARFMASDEAGNEYFATTKATALAAAAAFNRANPARALGNGVVYYARTLGLAQEKAMLADTMGYVNGVPVTSTPQFLATSANGTAFFSSCSQARANTLARLDTNRPPKKVWHTTNTATGQRVTSAVSAKAADALAAYRYVGYTNGELAAYGFNCQVLTAMSDAGLIAALQAQIAALPYSSYGGNFLGYDTTGTNPADMQMFRGATQAQANALAYAFGKSIVEVGVFVVDKTGTCATVGSNIDQVVAIQNIETNAFSITPTSIATIGGGANVTVNAATGLLGVGGGDINVGGSIYTLNIDAETSTSSSTFLPTTSTFTSGTFNMSWNMAMYDQGYSNVNFPPLASQELTTPFVFAGPPMPTTLPTRPLTCAPGPLAPAGGSPVTLLSYVCPFEYTYVSGLP